MVFLGMNSNYTEIVMNDIFSKQNTSVFIERFRAQGRSYDKVKDYSMWGIIISIFVVLVLNILKFFIDSEGLCYAALVYGLFSSVACLILDNIKKNRKSFAARIQQLIDCELFGISWWRNWGVKPAIEEIQEAAKSESPDRYYNWYDESINSVSKDAAVIICFRGNVMYDHKLRKKFMRTLHYCFWSLVAIITIVSLCYNPSIKNFLCYEVSPMMPIIVLYVRTWLMENADTANLISIRTDVESMKQKLINGESINRDEFLMVQDAIFAHRKNCFDIPSRFYNKYKTQNEESFHDLCVRLSEELAGH